MNAFDLKRPAPFLPAPGATPKPFGAPQIATIAFTSMLVVVVVSRLPEIMAKVLGSSFKIASILTLLSFCMAVISGRLGDTIRRPAALAMLAFSGWWIVGVPFSYWPGGSVGLFRGEWIFSFLIFFIVATVPFCSRSLVWCGGAMAWSAVVVNLILLRYGTMQDSRGALEFDSSLGNPNIAALQLLLGIPFLIYWTRTRGFFSWRGVLGLGSAVLAGVLIVTRTGSRSGLLILAVVVLALLSGTKLMLRVGLIFAMLLGIAVIVPFVPDYVLYRYGTLLTSDNDDKTEARGSSLARAEHLRQSIVLTFEHPLMGVGAGQFQAASAFLSREEGEKALWRETHNMYTQVSSELGLPGVFIYMAMIWFSLVPVLLEYRAAKRMNALQPRHEFVRALLISALGLLINSCFTSVAYQYYWPVMCAFGIGCQRVAQLERSAGAEPKLGYGIPALRRAPLLRRPGLVQRSLNP